MCFPPWKFRNAWTCRNISQETDISRSQTEYQPVPRLDCGLALIQQKDLPCETPPLPNWYSDSIAYINKYPLVRPPYYNSKPYSVHFRAILQHGGLERILQRNSPATSVDSELSAATAPNIPPEAVSNCNTSLHSIISHQTSPRF